jgi:hypothetical protein
VGYIVSTERYIPNMHVLQIRCYTEEQTTIYNVLHRKLKIEKHEPTKNRGCTQVLRTGRQVKLIHCICLSDVSTLSVPDECYFERT